MALKLKITEEIILKNDISIVAQEIEKSWRTDQIKALENALSLSFENLTLFELSKKLQQKEYKSWFRKLDREIPHLPFFLNDSSSTLLIYFMGNLSYKERDGSIKFDPIEIERYTKEKFCKIKNFCISNNIALQETARRLNNLSATPVLKPKNDQKTKVEKLLDKYGSIVFATADRKIKFIINLDKIPKKIRLITILFSKEPSNAQRPFTVILKIDELLARIEPLTLIGFTDINAYLSAYKNETAIEILTKLGGQYQSLCEMTNKIILTNSLQTEIERVEKEEQNPVGVELTKEKSAKNEEAGERSEKIKKTASGQGEKFGRLESDEEPAPPPDENDLESLRLANQNLRLKLKGQLEKIETLQFKNRELLKKLEQKEELIEDRKSVV